MNPNNSLNHREISLIEFVDEIYIDTLKNPDTKYIFFIGSGCSVSSGIPNALSLSMSWYSEIQNFQRSKLNKLKNENILDKSTLRRSHYNIFESLYPDKISQQKAIHKLIDTNKPSNAYSTLASIMQQRTFNTVITTNFDDYIQDSLILNKLKRASVVYNNTMSSLIDRSDIPLIIKLYGDSYMPLFLNQQERDVLPNPLKDRVANLLCNSKLIFIGYSGNDDSIIDLLNASKYIRHTYWINNSTPDKDKIKDWWGDLDCKTHVKNGSFDDVMNAMKIKFSTKISKLTTKKSNINIKVDTDYIKMGNNLLDNNQYISAIASYKKAIKTKPIEAYKKLANIYIIMKEYQKSIDIYKKIMELDIEDNFVYHSIAKNYLLVDDIPNSIKYYKILLNNNPNNKLAYIELANIYLSIDKNSDALELFEKAENLNLKSDNIQCGIEKSKPKEEEKIEEKDTPARQSLTLKSILDDVLEDDDNSVTKIAKPEVEDEKQDLNIILENEIIEEKKEIEEKTPDKIIDIQKDKTKIEKSNKEPKISYFFEKEEEKQEEFIIDKLIIEEEKKEKVDKKEKVEKKIEEDPLNLIIDSHIDSIELNDTKMDNLYDLGIFYFKSNEHVKALNYFKQSIELEPFNYYAYISIFEINLIENGLFDEDIKKVFLTKFNRNNKNIIEFKMLTTLLLICNKQDVYMNHWIDKYKSLKIDNWPFYSIEAWAKLQDVDIQKKLLKAISIFKNMVKIEIDK
jgi:tetratricopeptide (TPR) repeat protein